jgi:hypothetical protein
MEEIAEDYPRGFGEGPRQTIVVVKPAARLIIELE